MKVLVLNNNFYGSYSSNQVFYNELINAFNNIGVKVYKASSVKAAKKVYDIENIDFSVCFSKYSYYDDRGNPLYDVYNTLHYQWVSDNPLKMNLDIHSKNIKYIFIDEEYQDIIPKLPHTPLILPLGFQQGKNKDYREDKDHDVLVPCKIRNLDMIREKINNYSIKNNIWEFINSYDYDKSFIKHFIDYQRTTKISDLESFFRITNEYVRVEKRIKVVNSLCYRKVYLLCEDTGYFNNPNITFIEPVDYKQANDIISKFKIIINVDPNYHACVHDRVIKSISSGSLCISNTNDVMKRYGIPLYNFNELNNMSELIKLVEDNSFTFFNKEKEMIRKFSWEESVLLILENFKNNKRINVYEL